MNNNETEYKLTFTISNKQDNSTVEEYTHLQNADTGYYIYKDRNDNTLNIEAFTDRETKVKALGKIFFSNYTFDEVQDIANKIQNARTKDN